MRARRKFGLFVFSDTSCGLSRRLCKDVCGALGRAYHIYACKVFAKAHTQIFFRLRDFGDNFRIVQRFSPTIHVFHDQSVRCQLYDSVSDGFDVFVFRLRCHLYCRRGRRSLFRQRSSKRQMRFALRKRICAPQRRHKRVGFLFAHFTRLFAMI